MDSILNHLWQSTVFAAAIGAMVLLFRQHSARLRYWFWLAASVKFLIPFSLLVDLGRHAEQPTMKPVLAPASVESLATAFAPASVIITNTQSDWEFLPWIWATGALAIAARWILCCRKAHRLRESSRPLPLALPVPVRVTSLAIEPGVCGFFRPVLILPEGLMERLSSAQWQALVVHELRHVRYCDNLTALLHMAVQTLCWFHPLVWWIGGRLVEERERDCDQAVVAATGAREEYAQSILEVCKLYLPQPLPCNAGISGSDLRSRITAIMTAPKPAGLTTMRKASLSLATAAVCTAPFLIGALQEQTDPTKYTFEVASIRPSAPGQNGTGVNTDQSKLTTRNTSLFALITYAYGVQPYQVTGAPGWARDERYDVVAKFDEPEQNVGVTELGPMASRDARIRARLRNLLADRFQLEMREEKKELPVFGLVTERGAAKIQVDPNPRGNMNVNQNNGNGILRGDGVTLERLAITLSGIVGRPVIDETGLTGLYGIELKWAADSAGDGSATLFTALREQLGLRLEPKKGLVTTLVVERVERPSEN